MLGWLVLNLSMTAFSTLTWSAASPVPRQQNHLIVTGGPAGVGLAVAGAALAGALGDGVAPPPQADASKPKTALTARRRLDRTISSLLSFGVLVSTTRRCIPTAARWPDRRLDRRPGAGPPRCHLLDCYRCRGSSGGRVPSGPSSRSGTWNARPERMYASTPPAGRRPRRRSPRAAASAGDGTD